MPLISASYDLALPYLKAAELLAASARFRSVCGTGSDQTATIDDYIDWPMRDVEEFGFNIPGAVLTDDDLLVQHKIRRSGAGSGQIYVWFSFPPNPSYVNTPKTKFDDRNQVLDFRNVLGEILDEMMALAGQSLPDGSDRYFNVIEWAKHNTPTIVGPPEFHSVFRFASFVLDWN